MQQDILSEKLSALKGVGPKTAKVIAKKGLETFEDALYFIPRDYEDRSRITPVKNLTPGDKATILGKVILQRLIGRGRHARLEVKVHDGTGVVGLIWFHGAEYLKNEFHEGDELLVYGEVKFFHLQATISHPEYEKVCYDNDGRPLKSRNFGRIVPVYSETEGISQKTLRKLILSAVENSLPHLTDPLPSSIRCKLNLASLEESFRELHFPSQSSKDKSSGIHRIVFEEFFCLQLGLGIRKRNAKAVKAPVLSNHEIIERFEKLLPFALTEDQRRAIKDVSRDVTSAQAMCRLVQGDVGSGKTVVALAAAAMALACGYQVAIMVPTEILAEQHFHAAKRWLEPLGFAIALAGHGTSKDNVLLEDVAVGKVGLIIGTHALFQKNVQFRKLGLVVVDEQHRFGVEQRTELLKKAGKVTPHLLMMTATPIPRTLALTMYGDLDISIIKQKPANRRPVVTQVMLEREKPRLYAKVRSVVEKGQQVFIIYPLVENSEKLDLKSATEMFGKLSKEVFPTFRLALLHGRMETEEKDSVLKRFRNHEFDILVSTTVIEVGIDIANATLMVIEHPERLGLSQLHQLRGRVGRGPAGGDCILAADKYLGERLRIMEKTDDGFVIAEEDLKLRGPGEFLGKRQSGLPGFRVGHLVRDSRLLEAARDEAELILNRDPQLKLPEHMELKRLVENRWRTKLERLSS